MTQRKKSKSLVKGSGYDDLLSGISELLDAARRTVARRVNGVLTAAYWEIGRRIVEHEQGGQHRADYGEQVIDLLAADLTRKHGRGFSRSNVFQMRGFFVAWEITQTPSGKSEARAKFDGNSIVQTPSGQSVALMRTSNSQAPASFLASEPTDVFPMSWSHYVRLLSVEKPHARAFYEAEAVRGGWSVRQLDRQISTQLFERTSHSKRQSALLAKAQVPQPEDAVSAHDEIRDPYLLEFLNLKDDAGQMNLYLNYAQEHLTFTGESDPIGIILCSDKDDAVLKYATGDINAKVFASKYLTELPNADALRAELITTQETISRRLEERKPSQ